MVSVEFAFKTGVSDEGVVEPATRQFQQRVQAMPCYAHSLYLHEGSDYKAVITFEGEASARQLAAGVEASVRAVDPDVEWQYARIWTEATALGPAG